MSHNFKHGDLALIVRSRNSENVGRVVTVRGAAEAGETLIYGGGGFVTCLGERLIVEGEIVVSALLNPAKKRTVNVHAFRAHWLMPLHDESTLERRDSREVCA